jgi:hypothetical protein
MSLEDAVLKKYTLPSYGRALSECPTRHLTRQKPKPRRAVFFLLAAIQAEKGL